MKKRIYKVNVDIPGGKVILFLRYFKIGKQKIEANGQSSVSYMAGIGNREIAFTLTRRRNAKEDSKRSHIRASA